MDENSATVLYHIRTFVQKYCIRSAFLPPIIGWGGGA